MATYTVKAGDTFTTIAAQFNSTVSAIQTLNPTVVPTSLQVGQVINIPGTPTEKTSTYTIKSGDTFSMIAKALNVDVSTIQTLNPGVDSTKLQIGQIIKVPSTTSTKPPTAPNPPKPAPGPTPPKPKPTPKPNPTTGKYTIVSGDTFALIATKYNTSAAAIQALNPGVNPTTLQVGQVINVPSKAAPQTSQPLPIPAAPSNPSPIGGPFISYSGPATSFPSPSRWSTYASLWAYNATLMQNSNTSTEIAIINTAIQLVSRESGMDARVILCMIMQETGGNVRAPVTTSPAPDFVRNTGLMQAHNGAVFDPGNPVGSITQMIRDGAAGTASGDGLKQTYARYGNYYAALRAYNSGSVDLGNLSNGITATPDYVSKIANRLCGNVWANM